MKYEYENDNRVLTMKEIEKIIVKKFGGDRDSGCYHNGQWMSINSILKAIAENLW